MLVMRDIAWCSCVARAPTVMHVQVSVPHAGLVKHSIRSAMNNAVRLACQTITAAGLPTWLAGACGLNHLCERRLLSVPTGPAVVDAGLTDL